MLATGAAKIYLYSCTKLFSCGTVMCVCVCVCVCVCTCVHACVCERERISRLLHHVHLVARGQTAVKMNGEFHRLAVGG